MKAISTTLVTDASSGMGKGRSPPPGVTLMAGLHRPADSEN